MSNQQIFVLGSDGNLWLETGPFGDVAKTIATRSQVDATVSNLYSQVGENRIWRTGFQALSPTEIFVLGTDGNLWQETSGLPWNVVTTVANRLQVDAHVGTFQVLDSNTVLVLGSDGNLWLETGPFGDVGQVVSRRQQIDARVLAFQAIDAATVFVLGTDGNLWLEKGPFGNVGQTVASRQQVDANVIQFYALDEGTVYVLGSDLNLWYEPGPFGDLNITTSYRSLIDGNVNDFQPLRLSSEGGWTTSSSPADLVFVLYHDSSLWSVQGPYLGSQNTINTRNYIDGNVISFGALDPSNLFVIGGDLNLWYEYSPFGPNNRKQVDGSVVACQPLFSEQLFGMRHLPARARHVLPTPLPLKEPV
jgi:hypothetical protein